MLNPSMCFALVVIVALGASCTATRGDTEREPASVATNAVPQLSPLWTAQVEGAITDLEVARENGATVLATIYDIESGKGANRAFSFDASGKLRWKLDLKVPVRALAISPNGALAILNTHENEIIAVNATGKILWSATGTCSPYILSKTSQVICYHDDDAEPRIAFDVLNAKGRKTYSHKISKDVFAFELAPDESRFAVATSGGAVNVFGADFKQRWSKRVQGEVITMAFDSGRNPALAVLSGTPRSQTQTLTVFSSAGKSVTSGAPKSHLEQVSFTSERNELAVYSNAKGGQTLGVLELPTLKPKWWMSSPKNGNYFATLISGDLFGKRIVSAWQKELAIFDGSGKKLWSIPEVKEEGAFLYGAASPRGQAKLVILALEEGVVKAYPLK